MGQYSEGIDADGEGDKMPRLIDADKLPHYDGTALSADAVARAVEDAPTINTESVRRGRWIKLEDDYNNCLYECSCCHTWTSLPTEEDNDPHIRYCWSCGAKMGR